MIKRFKDFYGNSAHIRLHKNGSCRMNIYCGAKLIKAKDYKTEKGARIALGKFGDSFAEIK